MNLVSAQLGALTPFQLLCRACELAAAEFRHSAEADKCARAPRSASGDAGRTAAAAAPSASASARDDESRAAAAAAPSTTRPFMCSVNSCSKTFARVYNLKAHQRVHSRERPYVCNRCAKRFRWRSSLTSHAKFHLKSDAHRAPLPAAASRPSRRIAKKRTAAARRPKTASSANPSPLP